MNKQRFASMMLSAMLAVGTTTIPAFALEYDFSSDVPGKQFYQSTEVGTDAAANSGTIVVGSDGTIGTDESNLPSCSPLSVLDLPVGEYPDSWGIATDIAIAQNTIFPNAYAPTTQWSNIVGWAGYDTTKVSSGALPTGAEMIYAAAFGTANATAVQPMPTITKGGAIGKINIPSIGLNKYIYEGTSQSNMNKGVAHFGCTAGWDGNVALAGHNRPVKTAAFARLKDVSYGDVVYYTTAYGTRTYQVTSIETCATTDTSGLLQDGTNKLTMYTCKVNQPSVKLKVVAMLIG